MQYRARYMARVAGWYPVLATVLLGVVAGAVAATSPPPADLILHNAVVYTADEHQTVARAIAIRDGTIVATGSSDEVFAFRGPATELRDLQGRFVMPGLHDTHIHALGTVPPDMCDLDGEALPLDQIVVRVRDCIERYRPAPGEWLPVLQWNPFEGNQTGKRFPTIRAALDAASTEHPIILWGNDGHHGAVNSAALNTPSIPINAATLQTTYREYRGLISVDGAGEPSGSMTEHARWLVRANMDNDMLGVATDSVALMPRVAALLAATGITSIQDAAVTADILAHYRWLEASGGMTFRLRTALVAELDPELARRDPERAASEALARLEPLQHPADQDSGLIRTDAVKLFADGVLEGNPYSSPPTTPNAAMLDGFLQPRFAVEQATGTMAVVGYVDPQSKVCQSVRARPERYDSAAAVAEFADRHDFHPRQCLPATGELVHPEAAINSFIQQATAAGLHIHVHTIADRAVQVVANAFAANHREAAARGLTQSVAHLQIARSEDVRRLGELGVYASFTYLWAMPEPEYDMTVIPFIDPVRGSEDLYNPQHYYLRNAYPVRTLLEAGGIPLFGSDAPVGKRDPRPFASLQAALTRAEDGRVLNPGERLDIHQAIASYTIDAARFLRQDDRLGSLQVGKVADLIVLDRNIVDLAQRGEADQIGATQVLMTVFDGRIVHQLDPSES